MILYTVINDTSCITSIDSILVDSLVIYHLKNKENDRSNNRIL